MSTSSAPYSDEAVKSSSFTGGQSASHATSPAPYSDEAVKSSSFTGGQSASQATSHTPVPVPVPSTTEVCNITKKLYLRTSSFLTAAVLICFAAIVMNRFESHNFSRRFLNYFLIVFLLTWTGTFIYIIKENESVYKILCQI